jgi:hypothetical protein
MSIFGNSHLPKISYRDPADNLVTIDFSDDHSIVTEYSFNEPDYKINTSVITGKKKRIKKGEYHTFRLNINELTSALYNALKLANNSEDVRFFPYSDVNTSYQVIITRLQPYHLKNSILYDALKLELETVNYETI